MGLFDILRGKPRTTTADAVLVEGDEEVYVVGESQYQDALRVIVTQAKAENPEINPHRVEIIAALIPEPSNRHDANAIQIQVDARVVGYLSRSDAINYQPLVRRYAKKKQFVACNGIIVGGREKGHSYGVILFLPEP